MILKRYDIDNDGLRYEYHDGDYVLYYDIKNIEKELEVANGAIEFLTENSKRLVRELDELKAKIGTIGFDNA